MRRLLLFSLVLHSSSAISMPSCIAVPYCAWSLERISTAPTLKVSDAAAAGTAGVIGRTLDLGAGRRDALWSVLLGRIEHVEGALGGGADFDAVAGDRFRIQLADATDLDPLIIVYGPSGEYIDSATNTGNYQAIEVAISVSGSHCVLVGDNYSTELGGYWLFIQRLNINQVQQQSGTTEVL